MPDFGRVRAAFAEGGGLPAPSVADAFRNPDGIPDPRAAVNAGVGSSPVDIIALLRSGTISAEELLRIVAALAGIGDTSQVAPPVQPGGGGEVRQAFLEGGPGGPQPF